MAKVISWQIAGKFVYITPQHGSYILDSRISDSELTALKNEAKNWTLQAYTTRFQNMYAAVENMWGTTDLNPNASYYYNALQGEGVYMIGGADGVNTADYGKPFYNLVIENNNTSVGLGGDYVLDKRTDLYTKIYLERNGAFFAPPASDISIVDERGVTASFSTEAVSEEGISKTKIKLTIPANTQFEEDYPIKEYTITVVKGDSYTGKTVFSVVGVKDGEEGASYDLVVKPRQIKVTADGDISNEAVVCSAVRNGIEVINTNGTKLVDDLNLQIRYDFGEITDDIDDISNVYRGGISYQDITENGDQVNFYLIFNGTHLVDSDSCTISRDGKDNGSLKLELDNEMDGISVGSDTKLDITDPVTSSTGFVLYSGGTELQILNSGQNKIKVENLGAHASWTVHGNEACTTTFTEGREKGWIKFTLNDQFDFGDDYKDSVKITVWGQNDHGEVASATTNYLIMGIRGGKDGEVFKIVPNLDVILCDPNNESNPYVGSETNLTAEAYIGTERITNAEITYSLDVTYGNAYNQTAHLPAAGLAIADLITGASYIALYLWTGDTANAGRRILVDRETVPIIWQGANGSAAWVELGNEIDAVSVGWDTDLDLDEEISSVTVGTTVRVISGDTPVQIQNIKIIAPNGKEGHWSSFTDRSWDWNRDAINDEDNDNGTHTIARISITLYDGFDFDADLREQATIAVTAGTQENPWHGYAHYVIKGVPGGKDGYVYRLVPEVDYINFHPNEGAQGTLDFGEANISCDAYYGSILLDPTSEDPEVNFGEIYYSFNKICTSTGDTETGGYVTGMTIYPSGGVEIDGLITRSNYTNFKYLVFYLVIDGEIVDRETIPIIADGVNGHDSVYIELTNEIDAIGTDTDSKLDLPVGESRKATTGIILHSGSTHLTITNVSGALSQNSSANPNTYTTGSTIEDEESGLTADFWVEMFNGFEFGDDLKEKVVITVRGINEDTEEQVSAKATFVIAAIKGAKDGVTYKIQPTPDELIYDMDTQKWAGNYNNVFAYAYANGKKMSEQGYRVGVDYEVKTASVIWDLDVATQRWNATDSSLSNYTEGSGIGFATPASPNAREQVIAFYLAVKIGNVWTAVDRETVSLRISGKDGENGTSSPSFDLTNLIEVITTGTNNVLDVSGYKYYYTTVRGRMGTRNVPIKVTTATNPYGSNSQCRVTTGSSSDNTVQITVRLGDGFDFTSDQIRKFTINASFESDSSISDTLTFTLKSIQQPDVPEGESYKLRTNVPEVVITGNDYNPETIQAGVYLGKTQKACTIYTKYVSKNDQELTLSQIMTKSTYGNTGTGTTTNPATISVSAVQGIAPNGLLYIAAFDGDDFLDAEDIPVLAGGGSSGVIADLSDDVGVVATGDNERLEAKVVGKLSTKAFIYDGHTPLPLQSVVLPNNGSNITTYGGEIKFSLDGFTAGDTQAKINVNITASTADFVDFATSNPLQFDIVLNAQVEQGEEPIQRTVGYSLLGLRAGKDGDTIHLELNCDQVFHGDTGFDPQEIKCKLYFGGVDITDESDGANPTLKFLIKNSDMADADNTELWLDKFNAEYRSGYYVFPLTEEYTSEYSPLTIRAERNIKKNASDPDNWVLMDWETVQVLRNGNDGVGGIELKLDQPNYEVEQVDSDKVVTENVSAQTYVSLHSGNTTLNISQIEWLQSQSSYGNGVTFTTGKTQGEPWIMVGIPQGYDFSVNSPTQIRVSATGGTGNDVISRKATFIITEKLGGKGDRGPKTRLTEWSGDNVSYQDGTDDDEYWDIVYYIQKDNDGNVVFAGYFGCKEDHTSNTALHPHGYANRPKLKTDSNTGKLVWDDTDEYWEYYEDYDFIASKVATFGDGLDGWVIDRGKIQHTSSSITLDSDGVIAVANTGTTYYKYANGNIVLYAKQDFTNQTRFNENFGSKIPLYSASTTDNVTTYFISTYDYSLSGTSQNPTMVKDLSSTVNNRLYMYGSPGSFMYELDFPIYESLRITPTVEITKVDVWCNVSDGSYYGKSYTATTSSDRIISAGNDIVSGALYGTFSDTPYNSILPENGYSTISEVLDDLKPQLQTNLVLGKVIPVQQCLEDGSGGGCSAYCTVDNPIIEPTECPKDTVIEPTNDYIAATEYYYFFKSIAIALGNHSGYSSRLYDNQNVSCNVWFDAALTKDGYTSSDKVGFDTTYTNVGQPASANVSTLTYGGTERNSNKTVAIINGTNNGSSELYGDIVIAAGFENIKYVYKWQNNGNYIYTVFPYNSSMFGLTDGAEIRVYNDLNTPVDLTAYLFEGNNGNTIYYLNSSFTYAESVSVGDASKFANTRIYTDGTIITNKLLATDGKFTGFVNANGGEFNGKVHISEGELDSVRITNGDFTGNLNLIGKNIFSLKPSEDGEPSIVLSNTDIELNQNNYQFPFANTYTMKAYGQETMHWTSGGDSKTIFSASVSSGSTVTVPSVKMRTRFERKIVSATVYYRIRFNNAVQFSRSYTYEDTNEEQLVGVPAFSQTVTADTAVKIEMVMSYTLQSTFWGTTSIAYSVIVEKGVSVTVPTGTIAKQFRVGPNGFAYNDGYGGSMAMVRTDAGTTISAYIGTVIRGEVSPRYGFIADSDELYLIVGGHKFQATVTGTGNSRVLSWTYVS